MLDTDADEKYSFLFLKLQGMFIIICSKFFEKIQPFLNFVRAVFYILLGALREDKTAQLNYFIALICPTWLRLTARFRYSRRASEKWFFTKCFFIFVFNIYALILLRKSNFVNVFHCVKFNDTDKTIVLGTLYGP